MENSMITTALDLPGYKIVRNQGIARGIIVRSRSAVGSLLGTVQSFFGGNITIYTQLCEQARAEAFSLMRRHAQSLNANAVIGMRYDTTEVGPGLTEVLCYGSAVVVTPVVDLSV